MFQYRLFAAGIAETHIPEFYFILSVQTFFHGNGACGMVVLHIHQFQEIRHISIGPPDLGIVPYDSLESARKFRHGSRILGESAYGNSACPHLYRHQKVTEYGKKAAVQISPQSTPDFLITHFTVEFIRSLIAFSDVIHQHLFHIIDSDDLRRLQVHHNLRQQITQFHFHSRMILQILLRIPYHAVARPDPGRDR